MVLEKEILQSVMKMLVNKIVASNLVINPMACQKASLLIRNSMKNLHVYFQLLLRINMGINSFK